MDWNKENFENFIFLQMSAITKNCIKEKTSDDGSVDILEILHLLSLEAIDPGIVISAFRKVGFFATQQKNQHLSVVFVSRQRIPESIQNQEKKLLRIKKDLLLYPSEDIEAKLQVVNEKIQKIEQRLAKLPAFSHIWT